MKSIVLLDLFLVGLLSCHSVPPVVVPPPVVPPPLPSVYCLAPTIHDASGRPISGASAAIGGVYGVSNADGFIYLYGVPSTKLGEKRNLTVLATGFEPSSTDYAIDSWSCDVDVTLTSVLPAIPPPPSRDQILTVKITFQGLMVQTACCGNLPWFDAALGALSPADRQSVYRAKRAVGDTHAILPYFSGGSLYAEPNQPYQYFTVPDFEHDPVAFATMIREVIHEGFTPMVFLAGDGENPGYGLATRQLPQAVVALKTVAVDLNPYVIYVPGWDSVFYGWTAEHVAAFGQLFRALLPNGYLGIEFNTGHIPLGRGPADYGMSGPMSTYDLLLGEFDLWPARGGAEWQVLGRLLGPAYHAPPDQVGDNPHPPWYLAGGNPRGPYAVSCFEYGTYYWVRGRYTAADMTAARDYYRNMGCVW